MYATHLPLLRPPPTLGSSARRVFMLKIETEIGIETEMEIEIEIEIEFLF